MDNCIPAKGRGSEGGGGGGRKLAQARSGGGGEAWMRDIIGSAFMCVRVHRAAQLRRHAHGNSIY